MSIQELTHHPELLDRETLYSLRRITAECPYYQPARLLLLKNLYLLHDASFDEELQRSAIYFTDRRVLFNLVEAAHYRLRHKPSQSFSISTERKGSSANDMVKESRTVSLIDDFLSSIPEDSDDKEKIPEQKEHRKPTAVDATTDYVAYLLSTDFEELDTQEENRESGNSPHPTPDARHQTPKLNGSDLIDAFIENDGKITLQDTLEYTPEQEPETNQDDVPADEYLTETLAGIYIKQRQYEKALEIIERVNAKAGKRNRYYDDQKRFLQLLIANQK